jgi:hypothetical protein
LLEELHGAEALLIGQDLHEGQARGIVDGDVDELPADSACPPAPIAVNAMTDDADLSQRLHIEVNELSRALPLIAQRQWFGRLQQREARQAHAEQYRRHRRARHPEPPCDGFSY